MKQQPLLPRSTPSQAGITLEDYKQLNPQQSQQKSLSNVSVRDGSSQYLSFLGKQSLSKKHLGVERFEKNTFFQGNQSAFISKNLHNNDHSKLYTDQSSSMLLINNSSVTQENLFTEEDEDTLTEGENSNPKLVLLIKIDRKLSEILENLKTPDRDILLNSLDDLTEQAKLLQDGYKVLLKCMELQGKIHRDLGDYSKTVSIFKNMRVYCNISKFMDKKLGIYKLIIDAYIQMREYNRALIFAKKMLRLAWVENDSDFEIIAYDKIGLIYYYTGDLHLAEYFHEKAYSNQREPKNSTIRKAGEVQRIRKNNYQIYPPNNYETDSEDEFELGAFSNGYSIQRLQDEKKQQASSSSSSGSNSNNNYSQKNHIPVPRVVIDYLHHKMDLGRIDVSLERKLTFMEGEQKDKTIYNQMSLNRNLKNFMIQQYINHAYWTGTQDQLSQIKFYHLHKNLKNHWNYILRLKKHIRQQKQAIRMENILQTDIEACNQMNRQVTDTARGSNSSEKNIITNGGIEKVNLLKNQDSSRRMKVSSKSPPPRSSEKLNHLLSKMNKNQQQHHVTINSNIILEDHCDNKYEYIGKNNIISNNNNNSKSLRYLPEFNKNNSITPSGKKTHSMISSQKLSSSIASLPRIFK